MELSVDDKGEKEKPTNTHDKNPNQLPDHLEVQTASHWESLMNEVPAAGAQGHKPHRRVFMPVCKPQATAATPTLKGLRCGAPTPVPQFSVCKKQAKEPTPRITERMN